MTTLEHDSAPPSPDTIRAIEDLRARFEAVDPARQAHLDAIAELARIPREIVLELRRQGLSHEGVATVLGVSRPRAQQLARAAGEVPEPYRAPLSEDERAAIRKRHVPGRRGNTRALALEFNVGPATILKVVNSAAAEAGPVVVEDHSGEPRPGHDMRQMKGWLAEGGAELLTHPADDEGAAND